MFMESTVLVTGVAAHGATATERCRVAHACNTYQRSYTIQNTLSNRACRIVRSLDPYFAVDRPGFPGQTLLLTRSFSSVPRVVPRRLGNRPRRPKSPALSVARPQYITTNQPAHQPSTPLANFSLLHTPRSDRRPTVRPRHQSSPPPPHARSLALHRSTLAGPTRARPRSLARSLLRLSVALHHRFLSRCERVRYRYTYSI